MVSSNITFKNILQDFRPEDKEQTAELRKLVLQHPYFQPAYAYYVQCLKSQNDRIYDRHLSKLAAISPDRRTLEIFLTQEWIPYEIPAAEEPVETEETVDKISENTKSEVVETIPTENTSAQELNLKHKRTFSEWVNYTRKPKDPSKDTLAEQLKTIDSFLAKNPSMPRADKAPLKQEDLSLKNNFDRQELMTETLAKVFVKQQKYDEALSAYRVLGLKYPEKNAFFADQIKKIERLKSEK